MRWMALGLWLVLTTLQTHGYTRVWQSDLTLWAHAVRQAPRKPRPMLNLGVSLAGVGLLEPARAAMHQAETLTTGSHVPWYDRELTQQTAIKNLARFAQP